MRLNKTPTNKIDLIIKKNIHTVYLNSPGLTL
jgi:hypothetical protein